MVAFRSNLDLGGVAKVTAAVNGTDPQDYATVAQLNAAIEGLSPKDSVRAASTGNVNVASPGAAIDGVSLTSGDRILLKDQSTAAENGIYIWNGAATPATRAPDASTAAELEAAITTVEEGSTNVGTTWRQTSVNFTLGSGAVAWVAFGTGSSPASETTAGTAELATQAETDTGTDDARIVTPLKLSSWSGRARQKVGNIGDGSATQYDITHNWNTRNVSVEIFRNATPWDTIICDVSRPDANTIRLNFATAPTSNQFSYVLRTGGAA